MLRQRKVLDALASIRTGLAVAAKEQEYLRRDIDFVTREIHKLWESVHELQAAAAKAPAEPEIPMWANVPMHVTDDEEDAKWQLDNGLIDRNEYEKLLEEVGLAPNVEIEHY